MLWVALHFPQFRRQALSRGHAPPEPEREALAALAAWACQFTPRVSLEPPRALLMEVEGSLRYFGGRWKFLARLRAGLPRLGFEARIAEAPTARAALWMARGEGGRLAALPVGVTGLGPDALGLLANLGVNTLGGLLRLPREGIAQRFGRVLLEEIDQAAGRTPEAREFFVPPARFEAQLALPSPVAQADRTLFVARRLLDQMEGFCAARQAGVRSFSLDLLHEDHPATRITVGLAACGRDAEHFARLLRERLASIVLKAPVEAIRLEAAEPEFLPEKNRSLLPDARAGGEEWLRLVERLQARLGSESVHGLETHPDHRPECAFRHVAFEMKNFNAGEKKKEGEGAGPRPLWLLDPPRRLAEGEFTLLAGPERIESGWWDGAEARRDYFIASTGEASLAWIYREHGARARANWFLHGLFA
ncbi:MAG: DNA polymerase Y family protein [Betaproteobacteria bacterium]